MVRSKLHLSGRSRAMGDFGNITGMIDGMVEEEEQGADDKQKPWCNGEFEKKDYEAKDEKTEISKLDAKMEEETDIIAATEEEIKALTEGIAALDKTDIIAATEE